jgi:hypothetical protein
VHKGGKLGIAHVGLVVGLISGLSCCGVGPESAYENGQGAVVGGAALGNRRVWRWLWRPLLADGER